MTNKMKMAFVAAASVFVALFVIGTPFAGDIADGVLSVLGNTLALHEAPRILSLAVVAIVGLLCLVLMERRRS